MKFSTQMCSIMWPFWMVLIIVFGVVLSQIVFLAVRRKKDGGQELWVTHIERYDMGMLAVILLMAIFLVNEGGDMRLILQHVFDLVDLTFQGKYMSFYDVVLEKACAGEYDSFIQHPIMGANYNIILYSIVGIIMLPFIGFCKWIQVPLDTTIANLYFNFFLTAFFLLAGYLVFKIILISGFDREKAKGAFFLTVTSALFIHCTVGFSQLDIFIVDAMLLSIYYYVQGKLHGFALWIGFSVMLKTLPILIAVPLLLAAEKKIGKIVLHMAEICFGTMIFLCFFGKNEGYQITQEAMQSGFGFINLIFKINMPTYYGVLSIFLFFFIIICIFMYDQNVEKKKLWKVAISAPLLIFTMLFLLIEWHTQWFALLCPFAAMSLAVIQERRSLIYLSILGEILILISAIIFFGDQGPTIYDNGILPYFTHHINDRTDFGVMIQEEVPIIKTIIPTLTAGVWGYFSVASCIDLIHISEEKKKEPVKITKGLCYLRLDIFLFYISAMLFFYYFLSTNVH